MKKKITRPKKPAAPKPPNRGESWRSLVKAALERSGGTASLADLYLALQEHPKAKRIPTFKATIRRTVQLDPEIEPTKERGVWRLKSLRKGK